MKSSRQDENDFLAEVAPGAIAHFDAEGLRLLVALRPVGIRRRPCARPRWQPATEVFATLTEADLVGGVVTERVDSMSMKTDEIRFDAGGIELILKDDAFRCFERLSEKIAALKQLSGSVLPSTIGKKIIDWISAARSLSTSMQLSEWLSTELASIIVERVICVPIAWIHVEGVIEFGGSQLIPMDASTRDSWAFRAPYSSGGAGAWNPTGQLATAFQMAWAGLVVETYGDTGSCEKIAFNKADEVCGLLRLLWPGNAVLGSRSYLLPLGVEAPQERTFVEIQNGVAKAVSQKIHGPPPEPLVLSSLNQQHIRSSLIALSSLSHQDRRTEFQARLLSSILLYTRNSLHVDVVDRLVAVLVALESMLLRGSNEPIQSALSQRLAILTEENIEKRVELIQAIRRCYDIRSKFLHHGLRKAEDHAAVEMVLRASWQFFMDCALNHHRVLSMEEFHRRIDVSLLGGPKASLQ